MTTSSRSLPWRVVTAAVVAVTALLTGCGLEDLQFRVDDRVEIVTPDDRSEVTLPLDVRWTYEDFTVTGPDGEADRDAGYFAVFVDQTPMPPGEDLPWVFRKDRACMATEGCPDEGFLADHRIYLTEDPELTLETLPRPSDDESGREDHTITIVLLDGSGDRIGESAWQVEVYVDRGDEA